MHLTQLRREECLTIDEMLRPFHDPEQAAAFSLLGDREQGEVNAWLDALAPVVEGPRAGRVARIARAAQRIGVPSKTARNKFDALQREGWRGLADRRRRTSCAKMADVDCANLPAFANWLKGLAENYGGNVRQAWKAAVALWKSARKTHGQIPGYAEIPAPGLNGLPKGWSYPNFARIAKLTAYERSVSGVGRAAARCHAPMVVRTRVGLRPGEVYMADDLWHDVDCHLLGSQKEFVRAMELAVIDVYSASKIAWGLKPRVRDEASGKRVNLRGTDMRFLLAHLYCNVGYFPGRSLLFAEHGTAAVEGRIADLLGRYSNGAIRIVEGGIQDKPAMLGAWGGRKGGNPRLKAAIESSHRLPHFMAKWLPGQTGGDSRNNLPEDHHGRERYFTELCKAVDFALQGMDPERAKWLINEIAAPVMSYWSYARIVDEMYPIIDRRTDHELEGWEREGLLVSGFRPSLSSSGFFTYAALAQIPPDEAAAVRSVLQSNPDLNVSRRMSPAEVWNAGRRNLKRLPPEVIPEICGRDLAVERKVRDHAIRFDDANVERGRTFSFPAIAVDPRGLEVILREGESYNTVLNPFDPSRLFVLDARFAFIGTLSEQIVSNHADMEAAQRAMGQAAHSEAVAMLPYRMRHADKEGEEARARAHNDRLLKGLVVPPAEQAVRDRADSASREGDMDALLAGIGKPGREEPLPDDPAADLDAIFGPRPGSQE